MRAARRVVLLVALLATVVTSANGAGYTPVPLIEVGKPELLDIAYSPDGSVLATLTTDWIELLDAGTFDPVARYDLAHRANSESAIEFSLDGTEIAVHGMRKPCAFYDAATGELRDAVPVTPYTYAISRDFQRVAYSEGDVVVVWDRATQTVIAELTGDPQPGLLAVNTPDGTIGTSVLGVRHLAFHPDGLRLLVASTRETVALWDTSSGELLRHYPFRRTWISAMAVRPDGRAFAVRTYAERRFIWRFDDGQPWEIPALPQMGLVHYDAEGSHLWTSGSEGLLHRVNSEDGAEVAGWTHGEPDEHAPYTQGVSVALPRGLVASHMVDRGGSRIGIWSIATMRLERVIDHGWGAGIRTGTAAYLPRHDQVVTVGSIARRWDVSEPDAFTAWEFRARTYNTVVSSDESIAATVVWPTAIRVFQPTTGQNLGRIPVSSSAGMAVSATGRFIATLGITTGVWSVGGLQRIATLDPPNGDLRATKSAFTPDERRLVVRNASRSGEDGSLQVWDIEDSALLMTVRGGGPFAATERGIIHVARQEGSWKDAAFEVRRVGDPAPISVIDPMRAPFRGSVYGNTDIDPSGKYVTVRDENPATHEPTVRFHSAATGALLGTRPYALNMQFTGGGDYLFAKGPNGGRALYRTEEFLNIPSDEVTPRNRLLAQWGDVKRTQLLPNYPNPFNPETWIPFDLAQAGPVEVTVYDDLGRVVRRVDLGQLAAGAYRTRERAAYWDGRNNAGEPVAGGAYYIEFSAGAVRQTRRGSLSK